MKNLLLCTLFCFVTSLVKAQSLSGRVVCSDDSLNAVGATVCLLRPIDSVLLKGRICDANGYFYFDKLEKREYLVSIKWTGYTPIYIKATIKGTTTLPTAMLKPLDILIGEASITAQIPPVMIKEDTVMYNADAYHVEEGSTLEKLIEKLPGAEITEDGVLKINGIEYKKILVDGKEFFSDDPKTALKNLPANFVKRIKTYDRKSEQARLTGIDDDEEDNVIDLETKKGMKKGWAGNASAGLGTENRYAGSLTINRFKENQLASVIANAKNDEKQGSTASKFIGITLADQKEKTLKWSGNISYSHTNTTNLDRHHSETQFTDSTGQSVASEAQQQQRKNNVLLDFQLEWKPDTMTTLQVHPKLGFSNGNDEDKNISTTSRWLAHGDGTDSTKLTDKKSLGKNSYQNIETSLSARAVRRLNSKGRNISVTIGYTYRQNQSDQYSASNVLYWLRPTQSKKYNRYQDGESTNRRFNVGLTYVEPFFKNSFLQLQYTFNYQEASANRYGYSYDLPHDATSTDWNEIDWGKVEVDTALSSCNASTYLSHQVGLSLRHLFKKLKLSYGINLYPQRQTTQHLFGVNSQQGALQQKVLNWTPNVNFLYRYSRREQLRITYNGRSQEANIQTMQEVISKVNPQNIRYGNPSLKPSFTHRINLRYNRSFEEKRLNYTGNASLTVTNNSTSNLTLYNAETASRISKIMNINGVWEMNANFNLNTTLDSKNHFSLSTFTSTRFGGSSTYNTTPLSLSDLIEAGITHPFGEMTPSDVDRFLDVAKVNHIKRLNLQQRLSGTYRGEKVNLNLYSSIAYSRVRNSVQKQQAGKETADLRTGGNLEVQLPFEIEIATDCNYLCRFGYQGSSKRNELIWNVQLSKSFLTKRRATLRLRIFDLLHQRMSLSQSVRNLTTRTTEHHSIQSYAMLTFLYKVNTFGGRNRQK
ncbi:MAG: outer membrane beta-barrel protein [Bacteroidaceae bacterium]